MNVLPDQIKLYLFHRAIRNNSKWITTAINNYILQQTDPHNQDSDLQIIYIYFHTTVFRSRTVRIKKKTDSTCWSCRDTELTVRWKSRKFSTGHACHRVHFHTLAGVCLLTVSGGQSGLSQ